MSKSVTTGHEGSVAREPGPQPDEIRRQLQQILASPVFHGSKRCQQFLDYVCMKSLAGEAGALKERTVAVEVFGRPPHIDLGEDTIVRVGAREVRKRLAQYYMTPDGAHAEIRIDLPSGSYAPEFRYVAAIVEREPTPPPRPMMPVVPSPVAPEPPIVHTPAIAAAAAASRRHKLMLWGGIAGTLGVISLIVMQLTSPGPNMDAFVRFWDPVLRSREPLLIAMAHPIVYHPSA